MADLQCEPPRKALKASSDASPHSSTTPTTHHTTSPLRPKAQILAPKIHPKPILEANVEQEARRLADAYLKSRETFTSDTFHKTDLHLPSNVLKVLHTNPTKKPLTTRDFINFLVHKPIQRIDNRVDNIEYNALHFIVEPSEHHPGCDEIHLRKTIHHDIAFAVYKLNKATRAIGSHSYTICSAVPDVQLVILLECLLFEESTAYDVLHNPGETRLDREEFDEHGFRYEELHIEAEARPIRHVKFGLPWYVRDVQDLNVVLAYEGLCQKCFIFHVRDEMGRPYTAYAFLNEKAGKEGNLKVGVDMKYYALLDDGMEVVPLRREEV